MSESKTMKELHEIRRKNHDETKNMTSEEYISHIRKKASGSKLKFPTVKSTSSVK